LAHTAISTVGLVFAVAVVALLFLVAARLASGAAGRGPEATAGHFVPLLVPFTLLFTVAQFFTLFVLQTQNFVALSSDPLGRGWNLFGTVFNTLDTRLVAPRLAAYVEVGAVVLGSGLGLVVVHERAASHGRPSAGDRARLSFVGLLSVSPWLVSPSCWRSDGSAVRWATGTAAEVHGGSDQVAHLPLVGSFFDQRFDAILHLGGALFVIGRGRRVPGGLLVGAPDGSDQDEAQ